MEDQLSLSNIRLTVSPQALPLFTTVLQSGIEVMVRQGETLGKFLSDFPGFTADYLANTVQTIFLNGTAVDDLTLPLTGSNPVLALSAAMPGLAGAIFRKNSFHSALRTETNAVRSASMQQHCCTVILKLFNSIARDRGQELLRAGVCIQSDSLGTFFIKRPHLREYLNNIRLGDRDLEYTEFLAVLSELAQVKLHIDAING
ncbi:MAG: hypothetical protein WBB19_07760 [Desulforhopalus sp.]